MKYLQFLMLGGKDYVENSMDDEFIRENVLRNIRGAAQINGKVCMAVSDRESQKRLNEIFEEAGLTGSEIGRVSFVTDKKMINDYQASGRNSRESTMQYEVMDKIRELGPEEAGKMRFGNYVDNIKLLTIYNAPKGQIVEVVDLDQQIDITKNPNFKVSNKEGLYSSMHVGRMAGDESFRRHDMTKKELLEYSKKNANDPSNRAYTNERSYLVGFGKDDRILSIVDYANFYPHYFMIAKSAKDGVAMDPKNRLDSSMSPQMRETLINKFHLDIDQTSLLDQERGKGFKMGVEKLSKSKEEKKNKEALDKITEKSEASDDSVKEDSGMIDAGEINFENLQQIKGDGVSSVFLNLGGGGISSIDSREPAGTIKPAEIPTNQNSTPSSSFGQIAFVGVLAAGIGVFLANKFGGGKAGGGKGKGGKSR